LTLWALTAGLNLETHCLGFLEIEKDCDGEMIIVLDCFFLAALSGIGPLMG
jgi:hypothetical protein